MKVKEIVFITGTRADYGKIKSLILKARCHFEVHIFICGMHLLHQYGYTSREIINDGHDKVYCAEKIKFTGKMDIDLANTITALHEYLQRVRPQLIVVHGDRTDALAGAISGMLNNIMVAHIEGGEVSGTVDEAIRHSISKIAHLHFVANYESKLRVQQLGEHEDRIFVVGSPDIDIMFGELPIIDEVKRMHDIPFGTYGICIYHPVTTELASLDEHVRVLTDALVASGKNYVIIYPNNDVGSDTIIRRIETLTDRPNFRIFRSLPFEEFLSLLKHASFMIGNSSAGIREACVYGVPAIDIGNRQLGRYQLPVLRNIQYTPETIQGILACIAQIEDHRITSNYFGTGNSASLFVEALLSVKHSQVQKKFIDSIETQDLLRAYINEVCF